MKKLVRSSLQNLSISYELALAIGNSLNLSEMLYEVIHKMVHKTNAHRGIIWVKNGERKLQPVAGAGINIEDVPAQGEIMDHQDVLNQILKKQQFVLKYKEDKDFLQYCPALTKKEESVLIVPVNNVAILYLVYAIREIADEPLANLLAGLSKKLSVAIEACMAHKNIINEVQVRLEAEEELNKKTEQLISGEKKLQRLYGESEQARKSLLGIMEDVKQKERALKESNENFQQVVSNITTVVWKADIANDGTFKNTYTSPVVDELLELPAGTLQNDWDKYFRYIKPEYLERVNNAFREAIISPGKEIDCEYEVLKDNGQTAWFHSKGRCFEKNGKLNVFGSTTDITERKLAEEALRESETRYKNLSSMMRLMSDNLPDLIWAKDMECKFLFVNKACSEILLDAKDTAEPIGKTDMYFAQRGIDSHPEIPDYFTFGKTCTDSDLAVLNTKKPIKSDESGNVRGEFIFLDIYKAPFEDENGNIIGTVGCARIVTKEKQIEKELQKSEEKYRLLAENSIDIIWKMDLKLVFTYISPSVKNIFGYTVEEWVGTRLSQHARTKEFFNMAKKALHAIKHYKELKYLTFNTVMLRKDGTEIPVEITAKLIFGKNGLPVGLQGATRDITERIQAEEELRESEEKLRNIFEHSTNAFYSHTPEHILTYMSPQVEEILGYKADEALRKWTEFASDNPVNKIGFELTEKAIKTGKPQPAYELEFIHKNGKKVWIEVHEGPVVVDGKTISMVGAFTDITERKKAEKELKKYRDHLEELVKQRTKELEEKNAELERYNRLFEGREFRIKELRDKIKILEKK